MKGKEGIFKKLRKRDKRRKREMNGKIKKRRFICI
jgi:hypothetical protein